ncbi:MAG: GNAT family N-acetyltransferase [Pseudomonadota bacterium]
MDESEIPPGEAAPRVAPPARLPDRLPDWLPDWLPDRRPAWLPAWLTAQRFAAASEATWPGAETVLQGNWRLRISPAEAGSRAASAWAAGPLPEDLPGAVAAVEAIYAAAGLAPRFQLWAEDAALDDWLEATGLWRAYDRSLIVARPASAPWPAAPKGLETVQVRTPVALFDRLWAAGGIGPQRRAVFERGAGAKAIFLARVGMAPAGAAGIALDGEVAVTQALWVSPAHRRQGVAAVLMAALGTWAAEAGATVLAHAVVADNTAARTLYQRLGFEPITAYHYRVREPS